MKLIDSLRRSYRHYQLHRTYADYVVQTGGDTEEQIRKQCGAVNDYQANMGLVSPFSVYERVLDALAENSRVVVSSLEAFAEKNELPAGCIEVCLRHDVDGDVVTALKAAQAVQARQLPASFFLLHTAFYYGQFSDGVFVRHQGLESLARALIATHVEVSLHVDGLAVYQEHGVNGSVAVSSELAYLRSLGAHAHGVVAHNSAPSYGAENFEMFRGYSLGGRSEVEFGGKATPLSTLSFRKLGLAYEGNFPLAAAASDRLVLDYYVRHPPEGGLRDAAWQERYFLRNPVFERNFDVSIWLVDCDGWVLAHHGDGRRFVEYPVSTDQVLDFLNSCPLGHRIQVSVHPEYVAGD